MPTPVDGTIYHEAQNLGRAAFERGAKRVPAHDAAMTALIGRAKPTPGQASRYLEAWLSAWDQANLDADVPGWTPEENARMATTRLMAYAKQHGLDWTIVRAAREGEPIAYQLVAQNGKPQEWEVIGETQEDARLTISLAAATGKTGKKRRRRS